MQCKFLSALIYKKPIMRGTAALFTNRKRFKQALCVLFLVCLPRSLLALFQVFQQSSANFHTLWEKASGVIRISVSLLSSSSHGLYVGLSFLYFFLACCSFLLNVIVPTSSHLYQVCPSACVTALSPPSCSSLNVAQRPKAGWRRCRQWGTDTMSMAASHVCVCVLADSSQ